MAGVLPAAGIGPHYIMVVGKPMELREVVEAYLRKPGKYLFYNVTTGEKVYGVFSDYDSFMYGESFHDGRGDWRCFEARSAAFMQNAREGFLLSQGIEADASSLKAAGFASLLKKRGLFEAWVDFFLENNPFLADYAFVNELEEEEASKEDYRAIRLLMEEYDSHEFERFFSDSVFFTVFRDSLYTSFSILGASHGTYGVSFYRGDDAADEFYSFLRNAEGFGRERDVGMLLSIVTLYSERRSEERLTLPNSVNPYGEDGLYSSMCIHMGKRALNHLSKSMAGCLKTELRALIDGLSYLKKRRDRPKKDEDCNVFLDFVGGRIKYSKVARTDKMLHAPAFFLETALIDVDSPTYETGKRQGGDFAFTFRYMPSGNFDYDDDDPRKGFVGFVGILCDVKTGVVLAPLLFAMEDGQSLGKSLLQTAEKYLKGIPVPKRILVNSELDFHVADFLFVPMFLEGAEVVFVDEGLPTDDAYADLCEFAEKNPFGVAEA